MSSPEFQAAVKASKQFTKKPENDDLLAMYGLFKQATQDPTFEKGEKPGMFDLKGKAKRSAWEKVSKMEPADAEKEYVTLIESLKSKYDWDPSKEPESVGK